MLQIIDKLSNGMYKVVKNETNQLKELIILKLNMDLLSLKLATLQITHYFQAMQK
jgi:hypothetical protein